MAIGAFTFVRVEKAGWFTLGGSGGLIARWACSDAITRQNGALRLNLEKKLQRLRAQMKSGPWIFFMINFLTGGESAA
jgi:hypothetical protein